MITLLAMYDSCEPFPFPVTHKLSSQFKGGLGHMVHESQSPKAQYQQNPKKKQRKTPYSAFVLIERTSE